MIDIYRIPDLLGPIREQFEETTEGFTYKACILDGPPPVPKGL
jgi:hypothetical protein